MYIKLPGGNKKAPQYRGGCGRLLVLCYSVAFLSGLVVVGVVCRIRLSGEVDVPSSETRYLPDSGSGTSYRSYIGRSTVRTVHSLPGVAYIMLPVRLSSSV